jgi:myo-inositol-1(or 4)-monophosphatase
MEKNVSEQLIIDAKETALEAARNAGKVLRDMLFQVSVREKGPKDLVTDADLAAQSIIEAAIRANFPGHVFVGEESPGDWREFSRGNEWTWLVDPLDGTTNYVHRFPCFAVSIGLIRGDEVMLGVVYDPMADEMYSAVRGGGASLNGAPIQPSQCQKLEEAMVAASFPPQVTKESPEVQQFLEILVQSQSVRRLGSAALNLCYVANGRLDGYWANKLKPWDVAAGILIVAEAGGCLRGIRQQEYSVWGGELVAASTSYLSQELWGCLQV